MNFVDVLYLVKNNRSTKVIYENQTKLVELTINNLINNELQKSLSTVESRLLSTKRAYNIQKFVPIYINQACILQPITCMTAWNYSFVNFCKIKQIIKKDKQTLIIFDNNIELLVDLTYRRFKDYLKNCQLIKESQLKIERENLSYVKEKY